MRHYSDSRRVNVDKKMVELRQFLLEGSLERQDVVRQRVTRQVDFFDFALSVGQNVEGRYRAGQHFIV